MVERLGAAAVLAGVAGGPAGGGGLALHWEAARPGGANEVEQVRPLDLVELQGRRYGFEHVFGDAQDLAAFQLRVVLDADAREERHLLAPQPGDPSPAVDAQPGPLRGDPGPSRGQELADLVSAAHAVHGREGMASWGGAASTPIDLISLIAAVPLTIGAMAAEALLTQHCNLIFR